MQRVGYLGPPGTFSQQAALAYTGLVAENLQAYSSIRDVMMAVQQNSLDLGIIPIENSLEGPVNITLDLLARDVDLYISDEFALQISQNLMINPGSNWHEVTKIFTHPQSAGQCRKFIEQNLPHAEVNLAFSNAEGARLAKEAGPSAAAIGPAEAAEVFGLDIVTRDIQDSNNNFTRFVVIGQSCPPPSGSDKTSIVFSTVNKPGSLYRILDIFNIWDINLSRIESRPSKEKLGTYIFFIDLEGHAQDPDLADALTMVKRKSSFYKYLGSYPKAVFIADGA